MSENFQSTVTRLPSSLLTTLHLLQRIQHCQLFAENLTDSFYAVKEFCDSHDLKINADKTQLIVFRKPGKSILDDFQLILYNCTIKPQRTVKLVGVTLDQHLTFGPHIDNVTNKCQGLFGILATATPYLPKELLKLYIHSTHQITYGILIFDLLICCQNTSQET